MSEPAVWYLPARAKLNLQLHVVGRRADGYHQLQTLFHALELHDGLWLRRRTEPGIGLTVTADQPSLAVDAGDDNLVVRALRTFALHHPPAGGWQVHLHKRIPAGGGLGGGSSDAAAALRLAAAANGLAAGPDRLHELARSLGADVAFFLRGGSQWGRGVGDELEPAQVPARHFVLLLPPFGCPTADVYKMFAMRWNVPCHGDSVRPSTAADNSDAQGRMGSYREFYNDLQPAAELVRPALADLRHRVVACGFPQVCMSGSGSTLFVACDDAATAAAAAGLLEEELSADGVRVLVTRSAAAGGVGPATGSPVTAAVPRAAVPPDVPVQVAALGAEPGGGAT